MTDVDCLDLLEQELGFVLTSEQKEALEMLLRGKDVFCVLPTALFIRCLFMQRVLHSLQVRVYLFVEGRGSRVPCRGPGTMSRVEGNLFFQFFFFLEKVIIDAINVIKTNKKNFKNKWRVNIF